MVTTGWLWQEPASEPHNLATRALPRGLERVQAQASTGKHGKKVQQPIAIAPATHRHCPAMASTDDDNQAFEPRTEATPPVVIPFGELDHETLRRVIEAYVLREGTEYGAHDVSLDHKVAQVLVQLQCGAATIAYHPDSESVDIVATRDTNGRRR